MPSPVYQDMVNLIVGFPIWGCPSTFNNKILSKIHREEKDLIRRCSAITIVFNA
jgi:hypothetical protein